MSIKTRLKIKLQCSRCGIYPGDLVPEVSKGNFQGHEVHCCSDCWEYLEGKTESDLSHYEIYNSYDKIIPLEKRWYSLDKFIVM